MQAASDNESEGHRIINKGSLLQQKPEMRHCTQLLEARVVSCGQDRDAIVVHIGKAQILVVHRLNNRKKKFLICNL